MKYLAIGLVVGLGLIATAIYLKPSPSSTEYAKICLVRDVKYDPKSKLGDFNLRLIGIDRAEANRLFQKYKDKYKPYYIRNAQREALAVEEFNRHLTLMGLGKKCKEGDLITHYSNPPERVDEWVEKQCSFDHQIVILKDKHLTKLQCIYNGVNWDDSLYFSKRQQ